MSVGSSVQQASQARERGVNIRPTAYCYQSHRCTGSSKCSSVTLADCFACRDLWTRSRDRDLISSTIIQLCLFNIFILRISSSSHWSLRNSCQYLALATLRLTQSYNAYPNRCATMLCICYMLWTNRDKEAFYAQPRPNAMDILFEIMVRWPRCQHVISLCNRDHTGFLRTRRTTLITAALNPVVPTMAPLGKRCAFTFYLRLTRLVTELMLYASHENILFWNPGRKHWKGLKGMWQAFKMVCRVSIHRIH